MKKLLSVEGKIDIGALIISILIAEGIGFIAAMFTPNTKQIYEGLKKPFFAPPSNIFGIIWPILFLLMAIAAYRVWMKRDSSPYARKALVFYVVQLLLNFLWTLIFFRFNLYGLAFIELCILWLFIMITTIYFFKVDTISGLLMIPYVIWVSFAGILNFFIWILNEA